MSRHVEKSTALAGRRIEIRGIVQGVGFRPWVHRLARAAGLAGQVRNDGSGVTIEAFGADDALDAFVAGLEASPPPAAAIRQLRWEPIAEVEPQPLAKGFVIVASEETAERRVSIPPDLATCGDCLAEVDDPGDRRHGYAFTNCTNCGPRFTIARDVPYDRPATTMASFEMCPDCRREYEDPADRRFHAQPNACPACGPHLALLASTGEPLPADDPIAAAARALAAGETVAVKGIGGFHLACDATSEEAVARLRERKRREQKPFAVMVRDLATARRLASVGHDEEKLLTSVERPIVLLRGRQDPGRDLRLAPNIAPGNALVGLFLPYTPLHHLLLAAVDRPLVMTSGNLSDEPIAFRNAEAVARLGAIAEALLVHDRDIARHADDSVARVIAGEPVLLRRSRGWVPRPIPVPRPFKRPVLACGAHLKNTFCLGLGDSAFLGPHIGDLETLETLAAYEASIADLERFLGVTPEAIAHDLHPDYMSTRYARRRAAELGAEAVGVQHHHAHVAAALAELALAGPVLGVTWDGTGYGLDDTAWGGEVLLADAASYRRLATLRPIVLPGVEAAIREVWRLALALLDDSFDGDPPLGEIPLFRGIPEERVALVRQMIARRLNTYPARGAGRYFDALGAIVLGRDTSYYEGQVALEWNLAADPAKDGAYPYELRADAEPWEIDLRPMVRAAVADLGHGAPAAAISGRFHNTLAGAAAEVLRRAAGQAGRRPVVLTGGCFQNALLAERLRDRLVPDFEVHLPREAPPGDGGIALGQAWAANALLST